MGMPVTSDEEVAELVLNRDMNKHAMIAKLYRLDFSCASRRCHNGTRGIVPRYPLETCSSIVDRHKQVHEVNRLIYL
jgi:hypothetical protein